MQSDIIAIAIAYVLGVAARMLGLPPMTGYLLAGFGLYASGSRMTPTLAEFSEMGITLLLFSIGLKLRLKSLAMPQIWGVASLHMLLITLLASGFVALLAMAGLPMFGELDGTGTALVAFALSFSSTVFVVKILEEKGEIDALYGRIAIGILIMQDIAAVALLVFSAGKLPSLWALGLLALIPLRPLLYRLLELSGRGELLILFGLSLALGGAQLFELVNVKGDLGALILGVLLAGHARAGELAQRLLGFKDLFLVGFFLSIGLSGPLNGEAVGLALLLLLLLPFKSVLFFALLARFHLRVRTALLASLSLTNFSEFGLIVAAIAVSAGWLDSQWLIVLAITLSLSFMLSAPLNNAAYRLYLRLREPLSRYESGRRIPGEEDIRPRDTSVVIFGMGRVGSSAYDALRRRVGEHVLGVDYDEETVRRLQNSGRNVILGSATDPDFWSRMQLDFDNIELIMLAMPNIRENLFAVRQLKEAGYRGKLAAVARYRDEIVALKKAGVQAAFNLYAEAGAGFAEHVCNRLLKTTA